MRGLFYTRKVVFIGRRVQLRNKHYLKLGRGVTLQDGVFIDALSKNGVSLGNNCNIGQWLSFKRQVYLHGLVRVCPLEITLELVLSHLLDAAAE